jgi:putative peptidoglycan lipid II flippase
LNVVPALAAFAVGLPAFTLSKIFQPGFYAREDTKTPMYFALAAVAVNIIASLILSRYFSFVGIAMASSIAAWVNAIALLFTSSRREHYTMDTRFRQRLPRILASVAIMGLILLGQFYVLEGNFAESSSFIRRVLSLILMVATGSFSYFAVAHFSGALRLSELKSALRK